MKEIEVEILCISQRQSNEDVLAYIYLNNNLLDALRIPMIQSEPIFFTIASHPSQILLINLKSIADGSLIGKIEFPLALLLASESPISLPLSNTSTPLVKNLPIITLKQRNSSTPFEHIVQTSPKSLSESKSQNELVDIRNKLTQSEKRRLESLIEVRSMIEKHRKSPKETNDKRIMPTGYISYKLKAMSGEYMEKCENMRKEKQRVIEEVRDLEAKRIHNRLVIEKLKLEARLIESKLGACKKMIVVERNRDFDRNEEETLHDINELAKNIANTENKIEMYNKSTKNTIEQIHLYHHRNKELRSKLSAIESKILDDNFH